MILGRQFLYQLPKEHPVHLKFPFGVLSFAADKRFAVYDSATSLRAVSAPTEFDKPAPLHNFQSIPLIRVKVCEKCFPRNRSVAIIGPVRA